MVGLFPNFGISGGSLGLATLMTARGAVVHQWMRSPSAQSAIDGTHSARGFDKSRSPEALCNNIVKFSAPLGFVCFLQDWTISIMIYATQASSLLKRGCTRESPKWGPHVTWPTRIWLKIGMRAGNDLKLSRAKYFWTFISEKIA